MPNPYFDRDPPCSHPIVPQVPNTGHTTYVSYVDVRKQSAVACRSPREGLLTVPQMVRTHVREADLHTVDGPRTAGGVPTEGSHPPPHPRRKPNLSPALERREK